MVEVVSLGRQRTATARWRPPLRRSACARSAHPLPHQAAGHREVVDPGPPRPRPVFFAPPSSNANQKATSAPSPSRHRRGRQPEGRGEWIALIARACRRRGEACTPGVERNRGGRGELPAPARIALDAPRAARRAGASARHHLGRVQPVAHREQQPQLVVSEARSSPMSMWVIWPAEATAEATWPHALPFFSRMAMLVQNGRTGCSAHSTVGPALAVAPEQALADAAVGGAGTVRPSLRPR